MKKLSLILVIVLIFTLLSCNPIKNKSDSNFNSEENSEITDLVDFTVKVESGKNPIVLQFADPQIIDSSQMRTSDRLNGSAISYWAKDKKEDRCFKYMRQIIERVNPDLIIITGDIVYGEFDDDGSCLTEFISFMEGFSIPWAPIFGNHENESKMGVEWQCEQFENAPNCLFKKRDLVGHGNYSVGIEQGGKLIRVFYMLDSNGCTNASEESLECDQMKMYSGFDREQKDWYKNSIKTVREIYPNVKISFSFHIPIYAFIFSAQLKYGYDKTDFSPINLDEIGQDDDFGYIGNTFSGWDISCEIWESIKSLGVDSIFVGHEHEISSSIVYDGVRLQFGQKCSTYDKANYISSSGKIVASYTEAGEPIVGGSVIPLLHDNGDIVDPYVMLYKE